MKTFIKWSGNKSKHINKFIKYIPEKYNTYIEPFVGSGALLLKLNPDKWIINDINKDLINIYENIRDNSAEIINTFNDFERIFIKLSNDDKKEYCKQLTYLIDLFDYDSLRGCLYLLMKNCSYMGYIVVNNKFTFQGLDGPIYYDKSCYFLSDNYYKNIKDVSNFLKTGEIYNTDYKEILEKSKDGDFVFLDPPYVEDHNYKFNYNKNEILDSNFINNLLLEVQKLDSKSIKWLMTQADTAQIRETFKNYKIETFEVYRSISKSYKNELLIMNY